MGREKKENNNASSNRYNLSSRESHNKSFSNNNSLSSEKKFNTEKSIVPSSNKKYNSIIYYKFKGHNFSMRKMKLPIVILLG